MHSGQGNFPKTLARISTSTSLYPVAVAKGLPLSTLVQSKFAKGTDSPLDDDGVDSSGPSLAVVEKLSVMELVGPAMSATFFRYSFTFFR